MTCFVFALATAYSHSNCFLPLQTIDGVVFGGLVPWRTRINRLLGERLWAETLEFAVSLISRPNLIGLFSATADSVATKESVADFTAQKLIRFVRGTVALHVGPQHAGRGDKPVGPIEPSIAEIIQIAIKSALALGREDTIFADIFDIFFESGLSDAFIDALHPFIVQDSLATAQLSATFLNVLVTSRVARGSFFELEEDLLHLDIGPLNTDLVVNVCRAQRLWRGLVHVHNRQLRDHISPLVDLLRLLESRLTAINKDPSTVPDATEDDCYLVYVYLTYILTGKTFPRGFMEDASKSLVAKSNCWNFLLSATYVAWPPLHVQGPVVGLDRRVRIGHEPFPYLSMLVQYDDTAFFGMLTAAFEDVALSGELWIKPLSDGGLGSTEPALFGHGLDITRQFILDTLFSLLLPEYAEGIVAIPKSLADFTRDSHRFDESAKMQFVCFAVRALQRYSTFVAYDNHTCRLLLRLLCASKDPRTEALRESCVTDVVRRDINWLGSESSVADFDVDVEMLKQAGFYRAAESLAEGRGRWDHVVDCYFLDRKRRHEALALISRVLRSMGTDTRYRDSILARLVEYAPELAATDATGTARLVDSYAADSHLAITIQIEDPNVRLAYLAAIVGPPTFGHSTLSHALYESYIDLLCRLQPASVLEYLQTLSAAFPERPFSSSKVLDSCISHQVVLAAAWVLEASGDAFGALNLITASMKETFFGCIEAFNVIRHLKKGKVAYEDAAAVAEIYGNSEFGRTRARFEASAMDLVNKLQAGLGLCQRATKLLSPMDRRLLWFTILEFLMELRENLSDHFYERAVDPDLGGLLRSLLVTALNGMVGHMSLPLVLEEIVRKHSDASIGDYRDILEAFMNMYSYERGLLEASRRLLADDLFQGEGLLLKGLKQGQRLRPVR